MRLPGVVFAGQGVAPATLRDTLAAHRDHWLVSALVEGLGGLPVESLDLADTRVSQPATYVAGLVVAEGRLGWGAPVPMALGHSLGEITALAYAGVLDPREGLELTFSRGRSCYAAQQSRPGAMVAVTGLDLDEVELLRRHVAAERRGVLEIAAVNHRRQVVLSGDTAAVSVVVDRVQGTTGRASVLPIGGAFHSPLMVGALGDWRGVLATLVLSPGVIPVMSSIDARPHEDPEDFRELLATALILPVRWADTLREVRRLGVRALWEAGPGRGLSALGRRSDSVTFIGLEQGRAHRWAEPVRPSAGKALSALEG